MKFGSWYDKNYKKILVIPAILLILSIIFVVVFYSQTGFIFNKDVSLTGGTSYSVQTDYNVGELESKLGEDFNDFSVQGISDGSGNQLQVVVMVPEENSDDMKNELENILGFKLTLKNSSVQFTASSLSDVFFKQLMVAVILAFFWMAAVVFIIFGTGGKLKFWVIIGNLIFAIFLGNFFLTINPILSSILFFLFGGSLIYIYVKNSVPSFAVMFSAFADIVMTLAVVNLIGMKLSTAGIVAFLMLIGYSVDTDIMLTTRLLRKKEETNEAIAGAFKTGITMTLTSIIAVATALIVVFSFASVLNQIFIILLIGLGFDLINTWLTNASILKWYTERSVKDVSKKSFFGGKK